MKIVRQTESEIVVEDSSVATNAILSVTFLVLFSLSLALRWYSIACVSAPALLFAVFRLRKSTFVFIAAAHSIQWTRLRVTRKEAGSIAFSDVQDIVVESRGPGPFGPMCRLSLRAATTTIPISIGDNVAQDQAAIVRDTLLAFVKTAPGAKPASPASPGNTDAARTQQLNAAIRLLLSQGKRFDAILLVQGNEHLDLTEATFRVNQVASQMETKQPAPKA
jgi:hypothetical protein